MSPVPVFFRTLLKSSAIFIGAATIFLNPGLEWRSGTQATGSAPRGTSVYTAQGGREGTVDALIVALKDTDAGVRRQAARALTELNSQRAAAALARPSRAQRVEAPARGAGARRRAQGRRPRAPLGDRLGPRRARRQPRRP